MIARKLATLIVKRPKTVLLVYTIIVIAIGYNIQNVYMQSDLVSFLPENDPTVQLLLKIYDEFQIGSTIIIYVEADDIRDPFVLKEIDRVITKINKYDLDRGEQDGIFSVNSITTLIKDENAKPNLPGDLGGTGKKEIPDDPTLISRYMARPLLQETKGILYTDTYNVTVIIFQLADRADYTQVLNHIKSVIQREARYSDMTITGTIAMQEAMRRQTLQSLQIVFPLAALFVSINLFIFHRTLKGLIIGFLPLAYALLLTFGILGLIQPQLTILSIAVAALLLGLGIDYAIYLANRFAEEHRITEKIDRVERTLSQTGKAVFMCAFTTMIGFGSLMTSSIPPMVTFGFTCAIGILFCLVSSVILVPCLCLILKFEHQEKSYRWKRFSSFVVEYRRRLFVVACFFAVISLIILPQVTTDVNYFDMAPKGIPEVEKLLEYSRNFGGGTNFNALLIQTDPDGLTDPQTLEAIYQMENEIRKTGATAYSIADEIKKISEILDRNIIIEKLANITNLYEIIVDKVAKKGFVDERYSKTIVLVTFPVGLSVEQLEKYVDEVNQIAAQTTLPYNGKVSPITGQDVVNVQLNRQLAGSQIQSLFTALLFVLAALIIAYNSSVLGFIALLPVLFILSWEPAALVILDIPLSVVNITIASIMIGTGIDYSIQTVNRVREELSKGLSKSMAVQTTLETTGLSLLGAGTTTISALLSTFFVNIPVLHQFSIVVIVLILLSLAASLCILPTLLTSQLTKEK
ncbi:MAG: MMPL family transporter [Candidatus Thermoplasmatota archaeon]